MDKFVTDMLYHPPHCNPFRFGANFDTCTVVCKNGTFVEDKMRRFKGELSSPFSVIVIESC